MMLGPSHITSPNSSDVILGRGSGPRKHVGSQVFLKVVAKHKAMYHSSANRKGKNIIARAVVDHIRDKLGGRFIKRVEDARYPLYYEVSYEVALNKTKQALRERTDPLSNGDMEEVPFYSKALIPTSHQMGSSNVYGVANSAPGGNFLVQDEFRGAHPSLPSTIPSNNWPVEAAVPSPVPVKNIYLPANSVDDILARRLPAEEELATLQSPWADPYSGLMAADALSPAFSSSDMTRVGHDPVNDILAQRLPSPPGVNQQERAMLLQSPWAVSPISYARSGLMTTEPQSPTFSSSTPVVQDPLLREFRVLADSLAQQAAGIFHSFADMQWRSLVDNARTEQTLERNQRLEEQIVERIQRQEQTALKQPAGSVSDGTSLGSAEEEESTAAGNQRQEQTASKAPAGSVSEGTSLGSAVQEVAAANFLMGLLQGEPDAPRFSQEEEEKERSRLTAEERKAALVDVCGDALCENSPRTKRIKCEIRPVETLLEEMRLELLRIPMEQKSALLQAQEKACPKEFCDERLELFLRIEDMNATNAAWRFVRYWEKRLEWFGPDKFYLPMTQSGALRDDHAALQSGFMGLLPDLDESGRQVMFIVPRLNTFNGYTSENVLRLRWYIIEVASENPNANKGVVQIVFQKGATAFNFDHRAKAFKEAFELERDAWPVKCIATHIVQPPSFVTRYIRPLLLRALDKSFRSRIVRHDVEGKELVEVLAGYGLSESMLPSRIGGKLQYDSTEWIANRRRIEGV